MSNNNGCSCKWVTPTLETMSTLCRWKLNRIELNSTSSIYTLAISYILLNWEIDWEIQYEKTVVNCADMNSSAFLFQIHTCIPDLGKRGNCFRKNNGVNFYWIPPNYKKIKHFTTIMECTGGMGLFLTTQNTYS